MGNALVAVTKWGPFTMFEMDHDSERPVKDSVYDRCRYRVCRRLLESVKDKVSSVETPIAFPVAVYMIDSEDEPEVTAERGQLLVRGEPVRMVSLEVIEVALL